MATDPVKDAANWLDRQDPEWRKKTPPADTAAGPSPALQALKQGAVAPPPAVPASKVTDTAVDWLHRRFGAK